MDLNKLKELIVPGAHGHLVGIGGVSMSPLAEELLGMGLKVTGSDFHESAAVKHLRKLGVTIFSSHEEKNIQGADFVVRTAAAHDDNPEVHAARALGIPVFERAEAWGYIMLSYKNALCISGTHGKTTTTSMCTHVMMAAKKDPTVMIGGTLPLLHSGHRVGKGDTIIMESCEYYNSFHSFSPTVAVILNVEEDHLDFFSGIEEIKASFRKFADLVPECGTIVVNADDPNAMEAVQGLEKPTLTFGLDVPADVTARNILIQGAHIEFDAVICGEPFVHITLRVPGRHNILNALASCAAAYALDIPAEAVEQGLSEFAGAGRRFEYKGTVYGAHVYDDYAHHPAELHALLDAVESMDYKRILLAFQPHTYTRTKSLFHEFLQELGRPTKTYLAAIYAAREQNTVGISSGDLADKLPNAEYYPTFEQLTDALLQDAQEGDIILTVGAGDIYQVGDTIIRKQNSKKKNG